MRNVEPQSQVNDSFWRVFDAHENNRLALITQDISLTWRDLRNAVEARIYTYQRMGVGGIVVLYGHNQLELALNILALTRCGIVFMCIPRSVSERTIEDWIHGCGAQWCLSESTALPPPLKKLMVCSTTFSQDADRYAAESYKCKNSSITYMPPKNQLMMVIGGSGTTGKSKLIGVTYSQMHERLKITMKALDLLPNDRSLGWVHLEYASALHRFLTGLYSGGIYLLFDGPMSQGLKWAVDQSVSVMSCAVIHAEMMIAYGSNKKLLDGLRLLTVAGSVVSEELRMRIRKKLTEKLTIVYGTNECWYATIIKPERWSITRNSIGWPAPNVEIRLTQENGHLAVPGTVGYIEVRSKALSYGYLDAHSCSLLMDADGWFQTGDLARVLPTGEYVFCGRSDNMMVFNGINIYPIEIEDCLISHPNVMDAMVLPLRHAINQDIPCAFVALHEKNKTTGDQLSSFAAAQLGIKRPRLIIIVDKIPRNHQGKPDKVECMKILNKGIKK